MAKQTTRAFAVGLLFSALLLIGFNQFPPEKQIEADQKNPDDAYVNKQKYDRLVKKEREWRDKYEALLAEKAPEQTEQPEVRQFQLNIVKGMDSKDISEQLLNAGIIQDAQAFDRYLVEMKLQRSIQIGIYELDDQMDYEQIAKIITKEI